jgi:ankyrin repeat protein
MALVKIVRSGDVAQARQLFAEHPEYVHRPAIPDGTSWFQVGVESGSIAMCELLLSLGCDLNSRSPLASAKNPPVLLWLLQHDVPAEDALGWGTGDPHTLENLRLLDRYGADLHRTRLDDDGGTWNILRSVIHWATHIGYAPSDDVVEFLRFRGVRLPDEKPDAVPEYRGVMRQPDDIEWRIVDAVRRGEVATVRQLLTDHPDHLHRLHLGHTWLQIAAHYDSVPMIEMLIDLGIDVNAEGVQQSVPLDAALRNDNPETVRVLLERGANPNQGRQLLWAILYYGSHSLELVKLLDQHGVDLWHVFLNDRSTTKHRMTAFVAAGDYGKKDVYQYLKDRKAGKPPSV